jgi:hypothetical protein
MSGRGVSSQVRGNRLITRIRTEVMPMPASRPYPDSLTRPALDRLREIAGVEVGAGAL